MLIALLAYSVQSVAAMDMVNGEPYGYTANETMHQNMNGCHENIVSVSADTLADTSHPTRSCCDGGCPMVMCHFANAYLAAVAIPEYHLALLLRTEYLSASIPSKIIRSLYRPPILG